MAAAAANWKGDIPIYMANQRADAGLIIIFHQTTSDRWMEQLEILPASSGVETKFMAFHVNGYLWRGAAQSLARRFIYSRQIATGPNLSEIGYREHLSAAGNLTRAAAPPESAYLARRHLNFKDPIFVWAPDVSMGARARQGPPPGLRGAQSGRPSPPPAPAK